MKRALAFVTGFLILALGVPNLIVWLGGRERARRIFDVDSAVVVTQRFHMARALFDARRAGLDVTGYAADRREYGRVLRRLQVREFAARVKTLGDSVTGADPHFLGTQIPITGDGRGSWGPDGP